MAAEMDPNSEQGLLKNEVIPEVGEDAAASVNVAEALSEEEQEELRRELAKVEEEIQTLSQVLAAKEKHLAEIKRKLGISSLQELRQNLSKGWQDVTATNAYVSSLKLFCLNARDGLEFPRQLNLVGFLRGSLCFRI
ncbi:Hypothetical predicted protein [Podarcis lilfordi]|uniref:Tumor protein D52 n=1 Tax=Podarcis lilfordi TaxID=74358 RepID=A0AA35P8A4_9SAUR|nr:Hypothetical predicted protein [Podarcis lilfordi]